jgi:hypothetical protein
MTHVSSSIAFYPVGAIIGAGTGRVKFAAAAATIG